MVSKWSSETSKMELQTFRNHAQKISRSSLIGAKTTPRFSQTGNSTCRQTGNSTCRRRPFLKENVANIEPSWLPKWNRNQCKNDAKINPKNNAFQNRLLKRFWSIFGTKLDPCWHQHGRKMDAMCEKRFFKKSCSRCSGGLILKVLGIKCGANQNYHKKIQKSSPKAFKIDPSNLPKSSPSGAKRGPGRPKNRKII